MNIFLSLLERGNQLLWEEGSHHLLYGCALFMVWSWARITHDHKICMQLGMATKQWSLKGIKSKAKSMGGERSKPCNKH